MTSAGRVALDCIIFGLQRFGGISNYWAKLIDYVCFDPSLAGSLVLPRQLIYREFNESWLLQLPHLREALPADVARYLRAPGAEDTGCVFHTSYYRLPRGRVAKYIVSVYDFTYERYRAGLARFVHSRQKLESIRRADEVVCISTSTKRDVMEYCPGIDASKLHVVHLGVDREMFFPDSPAPSSGYEQSVLYVGHRGGYKRFDLAVGAMRQLPRLSLGIVGPALTRQERALLQQALGNRWQEHGVVNNEALRRLYSSSFAFIFPSDYEGFGLPILEAMACGCPVVAASRSSFPEVGGMVALYAEDQSAESYAAALAKLDSAESRNNAISAGLTHVDQFSWTKTMRQTVATYLR